MSPPGERTMQVELPRRAARKSKREPAQSSVTAELCDDSPKGLAPGLLDQRSRALGERKELSSSEWGESEEWLIRKSLSHRDDTGAEMIQTRRKNPWTTECALSFTVGWWQESVGMLGQVAPAVSRFGRWEP